MEGVFYHRVNCRRGCFVGGGFVVGGFCRGGGVMSYTRTFTESIGTKSHKILGKVAVGVVRESQKFSGHPVSRSRRHSDNKLAIER